MKKLTATILSASILFTNSAFCADIKTKPIKKVGKNTFLSNTIKYVKKNSPLLTLNLAGLIVGGYFLNKLNQSLSSNTQKLSSLENELKKIKGEYGAISSTIEKQIRSQNIMSKSFNILRNERDNLEIERCNMIELAEYLSENNSTANLILKVVTPVDFDEDKYADDGIHLPLIFDIYDCTTGDYITRLDARSIRDMEEMMPVYSKISKIISPTLSCNLFVCKSIGNKTCHQFSINVFRGNCKVIVDDKLNTVTFENGNDDFNQNDYIEYNEDNAEADFTDDLDNDNDSTSNASKQRSIVKQLSKTASTIYRNKTVSNCFIICNSRRNLPGIEKTRTKIPESVTTSQLKEDIKIDDVNSYDVPPLQKSDTIILDTK